MAQDAAAHYRNTIGAFTETIRISDFKANVAIVFTAIMMGPMLAFRDKFPHYIPIALALAPFVLIYFCLLICLYPRYINEGRAQFIIQRHADPHLFQPRRKWKSTSSSASRRCARSCRGFCTGRP